MDFDEGKLTIPYFCHEGDMARAERTIKRLWILCILLIILLVGSYAAFFYYENQFMDEVTVTQDTGTVIIMAVPTAEAVILWDGTLQGVAIPMTME